MGGFSLKFPKGLLRGNEQTMNKNKLCMRRYFASSQIISVIVISMLQKMQYNKRT